MLTPLDPTEFRRQIGATSIGNVIVPQLFVDDGLVTNGEMGTDNALVRIHLDRPSNVPVTVSYERLSLPGFDQLSVTPQDGLVLFAPGETEQWLSFEISGDLHADSEEVFAVRLFDSVNAFMADSAAVVLAREDLGVTPVATASFIDSVAAAIVGGSTDLGFDFDEDGTVSGTDFDALLDDILNVRRGDADLDGDVEFNDFLKLSANFGTLAGWAGGNFDLDGLVTFRDFLLLAGEVEETEHFKATFFAPTPYLSAGDLPTGFLTEACIDCTYLLEDFEDGTLNESISIVGGKVIGPGFDSGVSDVTDSVDADDGQIDGTGQSIDRGSSWYQQSDALRMTFATLAMSAGFVWTDGDRSITSVDFEAFDQAGNSLGVKDFGKLGDDVYTGSTAEDRFLGAKYGDGILTGISELVVTNHGGTGLEIDHIHVLQRNTPVSRAADTRTVQAAAGLDPRDINGDGYISPSDALIIIGWLESDTGDAGQFFGRRDVNGDGVVSPRDALEVIQRLNQPSERK